MSRRNYEIKIGFPAKWYTVKKTEGKTRMIQFTTLCYIQKAGKYLMLHRTAKENDINRDKWIGIGGHFEQGESPEECICREVREETGYTLISYQYRAIITFVSGKGVTEYMFLFTATDFEGEPVPCDEGELEWIDTDQVWEKNIWAGDKIFFRLLDDGEPFFSLKLVYNEKGSLAHAVLNGKNMELFDLLKEDGSISGEVQERRVVHREGSLHGTVHMWIVRDTEDGRHDVLLQKRSIDKDSHPGCYDISSAGHMQAGDTPLAAAVREMYEELGLQVNPEDLNYIGDHRGEFAETFYGKKFHDKELSHVYLYRQQVDIAALTLQKSEVESVCWMDIEKCRKNIRESTLSNCIYPDELDLLIDYLQ